MSTFWSRVATMLMGTTILQIPLVLSFVLFARYLSIEDFSALRQLSLLNLIIYTVAVAGLMPSLMYFKGLMASACDSHAKLALKHISIVILLSALMSLVIYVARDLAADALSNSQLSQLWTQYAVYPVLYALYNAVPLLLLALEAPRYIRVYCPIAAALACVPIYVVVVNQNLEFLIGSMVFSTLVAVIIGAYFVVRAGMNRNNAPTTVSYRDISAYAGYFYLAAIVSILGGKLDHILVSSLLGTVQYALYVVGAFQIPIYSLVQSSVNSVAMSQMVTLLEERRWHEFRHLWHACVTKVAVICVPIATFFAAFSSYFISIVFGEQFSSAASIFMVFSLLAPIKCVSFGLILRSLGKPQYDLWGAVFFLVATTITVPIGIWFLGGVGAALAIAASTSLLVIFMIRMIFRESRGELRFFDVIPVSFILLFVKWGVVMVALRVGIVLFNA